MKFLAVGEVFFQFWTTPTLWGSEGVFIGLSKKVAVRLENALPEYSGRLPEFPTVTTTGNFRLAPSEISDGNLWDVFGYSLWISSRLLIVGLS
jgi:hypothetical protein